MKHWTALVHQMKIHKIQLTSFLVLTQPVSNLQVYQNENEYTYVLFISHDVINVQKIQRDYKGMFLNSVYFKAQPE